jgi:hypothetical protein
MFIIKNTVDSLYPSHYFALLNIRGSQIVKCCAKLWQLKYAAAQGYGIQECDATEADKYCCCPGKKMLIKNIISFKGKHLMEHI